MPLVILCGLPASGKSTRAKELHAALEKFCQTPVVIISDQSHFDHEARDVIYSNTAKEKNLRASIKSDILRAVSKDSVVIVDALNYIKGYRYEIWCAAKSEKSTQITIWCNSPITVSKLWNQDTPEEQRYAQSTLDALAMRFEPPDSQNRWESPLFTVLPGDPLPMDEITSALFHRKAPPPNQSTQSQPLAGVNYLHELDRVTQQINSQIVSFQLNNTPTDKIVFSSTDQVLQMRQVSAPELGRLRRQFISLMRTRPVENLEKIPGVFVQYLRNALR